MLLFCCISFFFEGTSWVLWVPCCYVTACVLLSLNLFYGFTEFFGFLLPVGITNQSLSNRKVRCLMRIVSSLFPLFHFNTNLNAFFPSFLCIYFYVVNHTLNKNSIKIYFVRQRVDHIQIWYSNPYFYCQEVVYKVYIWSSLRLYVSTVIA